jgi:excisionase family DNA binding protein
MERDDTGRDGEGDDQPSRLAYTVQEVASLVGVSSDLIYDLVNQGALPSVRLGRRRLIPAREFEAIFQDAVETAERRQTHASERAAATERESYTVAEATAKLGLSEGTIRRMISEGILRRFGSGRPLRIRAASVEGLADRQR